MIKNAFFSLLFLLAVASAASAACPSNWYLGCSSTSYVWGEDKPGCYGNKIMYWQSFYSDLASARAHAGATVASTGPNVCTYYKTLRVVSLNSCERTQIMYRDPYACGTTDTDGDGVIDAVDPNPSVNDTFQFRIWAVQRDANGNIVCAFIETDDGSRTDYFGTYTAGAAIELTGSKEWFDSGNLAGAMQGIGAFTGDGDPVTGQANIPYTNQTMATGTSDTGNTTDSERLTDTVNNTKAIVDNQAKQQAALQEIRDAIGNQTKVIVESGLGNSSGPVVGGGGASAGDIGTAVGTSIGAKLDADKAEAEAELTGSDWGGTGTYEGYTSADIPEKPKTLSEVLTAGLSAHPLAGILQSSGLTLSSAACSQSVTVFGRSINFSLCNWSGQLDLMGTIILSCAALYAIFIVMGRG